MEAESEENSRCGIYALCVLWSAPIFHGQRHGRCERYSVQHAGRCGGSLACGESGLIIIFYTIPSNELFLGLVEFRPIEVLSATAAVRLVFVLDDMLAAWAHWEAVAVMVDADCVHCSRQTVCRGEQQAENRVSERTLRWGVLPDITGILMAEIELHFIIISALKHRWLTRTFGCIYVWFCLLSLKNTAE